MQLYLLKHIASFIIYWRLAVFQITASPSARSRQLLRRTGNFFFSDFLQFHVYDLRFKAGGLTPFLTEFWTLRLGTTLSVTNISQAAHQRDRFITFMRKDMSVEVDAHKYLLLPTNIRKLITQTQRQSNQYRLNIDPTLSRRIDVKSMSIGRSLEVNGERVNSPWLCTILVYIHSQNAFREGAEDKVWWWSLYALTTWRPLYWDEEVIQIKSYMASHLSRLQHRLNKVDLIYLNVMGKW